MKRTFRFTFIPALLALALIPLSTHAASIACGNISTTLCNLFNGVISIVNISIGILASLALLVFFWGLVKYILKAGDPKEKENGRTLMTYGVIALFVMFSVFGLVRFLQKAFGFSDADNQGIRAPQIPFGQSGN